MLVTLHQYVVLVHILTVPVRMLVILILVLRCSVPALRCPVPHRAVPYWATLHCTVTYCTVARCAVMYSTTAFWTVAALALALALVLARLLRMRMRMRMLLLPPLLQSATADCYSWWPGAVLAQVCSAIVLAIMWYFSEWSETTYLRSVCARKLDWRPPIEGEQKRAGRPKREPPNVSLQAAHDPQSRASRCHSRYLPSRAHALSTGQPRCLSFRLSEPASMRDAERDCRIDIIPSVNPSGHVFLYFEAVVSSRKFRDVSYPHELC